MRKYLPLFLLSLFLISCSKEVRKSPNIVYVLADQWRAQSLGYAGNQDVITPNLDHLASESINFTNAISTSPVCTPYRAMFLTGQYALKTGMFMNDVLLDPNANSLAKILGENDYNTAYIGKWHLDGNGRSAFIPKERRQGFEYWKVLECSHNYNNSKYWGNDDSLHIWEGYDAAVQTTDAISYIEEQSKSDNPFCLILSWGPPHAPYQSAPKEFQMLYDSLDIEIRPNVPEELVDETKAMLKGYYAHCSALDSYISQLQAAIKRSNIEENTIFIFTSDHGDLINSHGQTKKQRIYQESANVPFLIKYPALLGKSGKESDFLLNTMDILPTLLGMSGLDIPDNLDGEDVTNILLDREKDKREAALVTCVQPFGQWSKARGGRAFRGIITKKYTYARDLNGEWLLFDNVADPFQMKNLVGNSAFTETTKELEALLTNELSKLNDDFMPGPTYLEKWGHVVNETGTVPYTR